MTHEIVKFFPKEAPERGNAVLVDPIEGERRRCRIVRSPPLDWDGLDWTIRGPMVVVEDPIERA